MIPPRSKTKPTNPDTHEGFNLKRKNGLTIAVIVALCLTAGLSLRYAITPYLMSLSERNSSGFDLQGTVTDVDGNPLDGVSVEVAFSRAKTWNPNIAEYESYRETVNSEFHVRQQRFTGAEFAFVKEGYYTEKRYFRSLGAVTVRHDIQVKMIQTTMPWQPLP